MNTNEDLQWDNTKRRAGGLEGRVAKWKTWIFRGLASCTLGRAGGLHIKVAYGKARAGGLPFSAARPALFRNLPDRLFVQPARDDRIVDFYYPILSCFWKMISVSDPNHVLVEIILSVSENYSKMHYDAQHIFVCFVYFASWGKITSGVNSPSAVHDWLK